MLKRKSACLAIFTAVILAFYPQIASAETFKSSDFLKWQKSSQAFYIEASVGMTSLIAQQNDKTQAKCIDEWYYSDEAEKNKFILDTMKRVPNYHPRGVILAVIEKQCQPIIYSNGSE